MNFVAQLEDYLRDLGAEARKKHPGKSICFNDKIGGLVFPFGRLQAVLVAMNLTYIPFCSYQASRKLPNVPF